MRLVSLLTKIPVKKSDKESKKMQGPKVENPQGQRELETRQQQDGNKTLKDGKQMGGW